MRFYIDLDTLRIVALPGYSPAPVRTTFRRNDIIPIEVQFTQDGLVVDPGNAAANVYFAVKSQGYYTQNPALVAVGPFAKTGSGATTLFTMAAVAFSTAEINTAFNLSDNLEEINCYAEFAWTNAGATLVATTEKIACYLQNDLYTVVATAPEQRSAIWLPTVTSLTGGGATALDGLISAGISVPQTYLLTIGGVLQTWTLQAGTEAENAAGGIVRPDDFNLLTNAKIFRRMAVGSGTSGVDETITSLATLAALSTTQLNTPTVKVWVNSADQTTQVWVLKASTAATDAGSVQRPDDYDAGTNAKVWFRAS